MKVTPLEIRQKSFEKVFRGYDKDEVDAFLLSLSQQWEKSQDDYKELKYKQQATEREIVKLREVENTLFKTLKTAEDTGANVIEQANRTAELHLKEAKMKAEAITSESRSKAKALIENAEQKARQIIEEMEGEVKSLEQTYKAMINQRDNLLVDLRNLANDTLGKVERIESQKERYAIDDLVRKSRETAGEVRTFQPTPLTFEKEGEDEQKELSEEHSSDEPDNEKEVPKETAEATEEKESPEKKSNQGGSFFDSIG